MVRQLVASIFHIEKVSLDELKQISVVETWWHFGVLVFSEPNLNVSDCLKFVFSEIVPAEKHCSFIVIALDIDQVVFRRLHLVSYQRWHIVRVFFAVQGI